MRASWLALTAAVTVSLVASAQPAGQPTPPEAGEPPGLASTQGFTETFETQPLQGWELNPGVQVQQVGQGHALVFGQAGVAWAPTGAQDFALSFKYRPATGPMEAVVRASGEPPNQCGYHVMLMPGEVVLLREFGQGNMTELDGAACQFQSGAWNQVGLQVSGGQLTVSVGGQQLMSATDAQPLPAGGVGFMSQQGGDAIDDVSLTSAAAGAATPTAPTAGQPAPTAGQQPATAPVVQPTPGQPGQPPVATVQPVGAGAMSENFDAGQPQQGWELGGGAAVQDGALTFNSPGEAWWIAVQQKDLTLRCRYRPGQGVLDLVLCASGEPPNNQEYRLLLEGNQVALSRGSGGQVTQLAAGQYAWQPQQWHDLAVQVIGGQIAVHVNNQAVLTATDPQPPPAGTVGFILPQGGGAAIDDLYVSTPGGGAPAMQPLQGTLVQPGGVQGTGMQLMGTPQGQSVQYQLQRLLGQVTSGVMAQVPQALLRQIPAPILRLLPAEVLQGLPPEILQQAPAEMPEQIPQQLMQQLPPELRQALLLLQVTGMQLPADR